MGTAATTHIEGAERLASTLRQFARSLDDFSKSHRAAAQTVGAEASRRAPRRTGRLAASWRPEPSKTTAAVRFGSAYAPAHQWGVGPRGGLRGPHNIRASYFASGALSATEAETVALYTRELGDKLGGVRGA